MQPRKLHCVFIPGPVCSISTHFNHGIPLQEPRSGLWNLHWFLRHRWVTISFDQEGLHHCRSEVHLLRCALACCGSGTWDTHGMALSLDQALSSKTFCVHSYDSVVFCFWLIFFLYMDVELDDFTWHFIAPWQFRSTHRFMMDRAFHLDPLMHTHAGSCLPRTYGAIAKRIVTILVLHLVLPIILYLRIDVDSFDRGFVGAGICRDLQGCNMLQPLNGLGENLTAPLYCCVRETPRRSEEALCSCSTRLQQDVSLGWKRCLLCGVAAPSQDPLKSALCHSARWRLSTKHLDSKVPGETAGGHALLARFIWWFLCFLGKSSWAQTSHCWARDFPLKQQGQDHSGSNSPIDVDEWILECMHNIVQYVCIYIYICI